MKTYIFFLLTFLAAFAPSCGEDDVMDIKLIKGQWVLQSGAENKVIYKFDTKGEQTYSWGDLTIYSISSSGEKVDEKFYDWRISDPKNDSPIHLDITAKDLTDDNDIWDGEEHYVVDKLTAKEMILRKNEVGGLQDEALFYKISVGRLFVSL